jgi:hypothetical protein
MLRALARMIGMFIGIAVCAAIGLAAGGRAIAADGAPAAALIQCASPDTAIGAAIAAAAIVALIAAAYARLVGFHFGVILMGIACAAYGTRTGTAVDFARDGGDGRLLALETLASGAAIALAVWALARLAAAADAAPAPPDPSPLRRITAIVIGLLVIAPVAWLIARSEMRGQVVAAATLASAVSALASSLVGVQPRSCLRYLTPCIAGAAWSAIVWMWVGGVDPVNPAAGWSPLALPMPQDWAAGSLIGVTLGNSWARSFMADVTEAETNPTSPASKQEATA